MNTKRAKRTIPVVQAGHALMSLRDSGHSLPTALGEPIDNSLEANANTINVWLYKGLNETDKKHVHEIAIADDGDGMDFETLFHYLVLGYSTRYMSTTTIGKYGVGAKLAAYNFCTHIRVWSRQEATKPWMMVEYDLRDALVREDAGEEICVEEPINSDIPDEFAEACQFDTGTLVVWSNVGRLEEGRMAKNFGELCIDVEKELSRIFRYFIDGGRTISLNGKKLVAHDPLMLMEGSWSDVVLSRRSGGKKKPIQHFPATLIGEEEIKVGPGRAILQVTLYPTDVIRTRGSGGDQLAKRLHVPENEGSISFVRHGREVSYTNVPRIFGRGVQELDRFIGIEVAFQPELDDYFGIRNVKRGVEPHGELREKIRDQIKKHVLTARNRLDEVRGAADREKKKNAGKHGAVTEAVKNVNVTLPAGRSGADKTDEDSRRALRDLAKDIGLKKEEEIKNYIKQAEEFPFVVESVDFPGNVFMQTEHIKDTVIIRINTRHRFYRDMWAPLKSIADRDGGTVSGDEAVQAARQTIEALTLLLITYGKAESFNDNPAEAYGDLLMFWGQFLSSLMSKVKGVL